MKIPEYIMDRCYINFIYDFDDGMVFFTDKKGKIIKIKLNEFKNDGWKKLIEIDNKKTGLEKEYIKK